MNNKKNEFYIRNNTSKIIVLGYILGLLYRVFIVGRFGNDDIARYDIIYSVYTPAYRALHESWEI